MAQYIDKSALVAEIKRRKQTWQHQDQQYSNGGKDVCDYLLGFLDTLEVKEGEQILANSAKSCKDEQIKAIIESLRHKWSLGDSTEAKYKVEAFDELIEMLKEVNNEVENTKKEHLKKVRRKAVKKSNTYERGC